MVNNLKENICSLADQELFDIVHANSQDYLIEAIEIAKEEIKKRNLNPEQIKEKINESEKNVIIKENIFITTKSLTKALIIAIKLTIVFLIITLPIEYNNNPIGVLWAGLFTVTFLLFLIWIFKSNANVRALGATNMDFTPGWSVGWFFFKPYFVMVELWKCSNNPNNWELLKPPSHLLNWWLFWIAFLILGEPPRFLTPLMELSQTTIGIILTKIIGIVAYVYSFKIVNEIFNVQQNKHLTLTPPDGK